MRLAYEGRLADLGPDRLRSLVERRPPDESDLRERTRAIVERVRSEGDPALIEMARRFDGVRLASLEVPRARWDEALVAIDPAVRAALERAAGNIERFHRAQIPADLVLEVEPGVTLGRRFVPLDTVGVYAPGGRAAYPSSVLMGVVPARAAGVPEVVVCSPPGPSGAPSAVVLAAAALGGATRLFAVGGAGAVAAMAWGTASVPRCRAVVGPGNQWVTEAKRQVAGEVRIDSPAGPSEVLVVADGGADPERVAAELVAQAEHDPEAAVVLVALDAAFADAVRPVLADQVERAPRREVIEAALGRHGAILVADDRAAALAFVQTWAPEHLALHTADPHGDMERVLTAGTIFLGDDASVAFGDYLSGANHVLPTAGAAHSFSGLSTPDFMRSFTWQSFTPEGAGALAAPTITLAEAESLPGHAAAARLRLRGGAPSGGTP